MFSKIYSILSFVNGRGNQAAFFLSTIVHLFYLWWLLSWNSTSMVQVCRNVLTTEGRWLQTLEIHNLATDGSQSQTTLEKTRKKIQSSNATWVKRECCFEGNVLLTSMWILVLMKCRINYSHYDISIELNAFCQLNSIKLVLLYSIIRLYY